MSIDEPNKVDGLGIDRLAREVVLLISDHLSWEDDGAHLLSLERKLGEYIKFVRSGQVFESLPEAKGMAIRIKLIHEHQPTAAAYAILKAVAAQLHELGIAFSHHSLPIA